VKDGTFFFINTETSFPEGRWLGQTRRHDYACFVVQTASFRFSCAQAARGCIESGGSLKTKLHLYFFFFSPNCCDQHTISEWTV